MGDKCSDATERFTGLADVYAQRRPDYPPAAVDFILAHCTLKPGATLVDLGCGTGEAVRIENQRHAAGAPLLTCPLFEAASRADFSHTQTVDEEGMLGRAFSASYAPREPAERARFKAALADVFARYQQAGRVT